MKIGVFFKTDATFFIIAIFVFSCIMFAMNAGFPYYPLPPPSQMPQQPASQQPQ